MNHPTPLCPKEFIDLYLDMPQLTPPMSNDDENKQPSTTKTRSNHSESMCQKEKKSNQVQYRILQRGEPADELISSTKKSQTTTNEMNISENSTPGKSQRNRRKYLSLFI